jgi:hypothetical protein
MTLKAGVSVCKTGEKSKDSFIFLPQVLKIYFNFI